MNVQVEGLDANLVDEVVNLTLQLVGEKNTRLDLAATKTSGTGFVYTHIHGRTHTLTRNLHQAKLAQRQNVVASAVFLHVLAHALVEHLPVFCHVHVDEVDDDDAAHVAEAKLAGQLIGSAKVHVERGLLICVAISSRFALCVTPICILMALSP